VPTFDQQQKDAMRLGGELGMVAWLSSRRRQNEAEADAARAAFEATPQGELAAIEQEMAVLGAACSPEQWALLHTSQGLPIPEKPNEANWPTPLRNRVHAERMAALIRERKTR
jgi:hypothetical protein